MQHIVELKDEGAQDPVRLATRVLNVVSSFPQESIPQRIVRITSTTFRRSLNVLDLFDELIDDARWDIRVIHY